MKKMWWLAMVSAVLLACSEGVSNRQSLDSLQNKVDSVAERTWDSGKKDLKNLKDRIQDKLTPKDSLDH